MATNATVVVGTTPTLLFTGSGRNQVVLTNNGAGAVTYGGPDVTAGAGSLLAAAARELITVRDDGVYGIVASGTASVAVSSWLA